MRWKNSRKSSRYTHLWWRNRGKNVELPWLERLLVWVVKSPLATFRLGGLELPSISNSNHFSLDILFQSLSISYLEPLTFCFPYVLEISSTPKCNTNTRNSRFCPQNNLDAHCLFLKCLSTLGLLYWISKISDLSISKQFSEEIKLILRSDIFLYEDEIGN